MKCGEVMMEFWFKKIPCKTNWSIRNYKWKLNRNIKQQQQLIKITKTHNTITKTWTKVKRKTENVKANWKY